MLVEIEVDRVKGLAILDRPSVEDLKMYLSAGIIKSVQKLKYTFM